MLAIISPDRQATVYCNEIDTIARVQRRVIRPTTIEAGTRMFRSDIADIVEVEFRDADGATIDIPPDHGLSLVISHGWRKALFYD